MHFTVQLDAKDNWGGLPNAARSLVAQGIRSGVPVPRPGLGYLFWVDRPAKSHPSASPGPYKIDAAAPPIKLTPHNVGAPGEGWHISSAGSRRGVGTEFPATLRLTAMSSAMPRRSRGDRKSTRLNSSH